MSKEDPQARDTSAWMAVLDRLVDDMTRALEQMPPASSVPSAEAGFPPLKVIDRRLDEMQAGLERAEHTADEADRQLAVVLDPIQEWLARMSATQEKLSEKMQ
jgi:hypothetical protein